jgi:hypothetical protein
LGAATGFAAALRGGRATAGALVVGAAIKLRYHPASRMVWVASYRMYRLEESGRGCAVPRRFAVAGWVWTAEG